MIREGWNPRPLEVDGIHLDGPCSNCEVVPRAPDFALELYKCSHSTTVVRKHCLFLECLLGSISVMSEHPQESHVLIPNQNLAIFAPTPDGVFGLEQTQHLVLVSSQFGNHGTFLKR